MKYIVTLFLILCSMVIYAQKITVKDCYTKKPLKNVIIYTNGGSNYIHTNKEGKADLSSFKEDDILFFYHLSYQNYHILKKKITHKIELCKGAEKFEELILSASKSKEKRNRIAESVAVVSQAEIQKIAPQTSADLLGNMQGVKVQKSQFGGGSPVLRGMEANRVLLVVDGVRMNNAIYRMGHLQNSITVSPNILERTEVLFGPSSVVYGSDALGGVVHYYTKTPKIAKKFKINTSLYSRYSSVNNEFLNTINLHLQNKKWASFTSVSYSKYGDLKMGENRTHKFENWGKVFEYSNNSNTHYNAFAIKNENPSTQPKTGYSQWDVLQKIKIPLAKKNELLFNFQYSQSSDIHRFDKLTAYFNDKLKFAEWYYGPQKRLLLSSQLKLTPQKKWMEKGTVTLAYQNIKESRIQRKFNSLLRSYKKENVNVFSVNGDFLVPIQPQNNSVISYGFEATYNDVNSNAFGKKLQVKNNEITGFDAKGNFVVQSRYPDGGSSYGSGAVYLSYRQDITSKSTLNSGVRYSFTQLNAHWEDMSFVDLLQKDIAIHNSAVTATLGFVYNHSKDWQLNAVASSGFRSPNIDDIGKIREKSGKVTMPNIYLKPEYAYNFEVGTIKYFNNKRFKMNVTGYYTLLTNYIARDYMFVNYKKSKTIYDNENVDVISNVNKGKAFVFGGTFGFKGIITDHIFTNAFVTYTKGETYDTKRPLSSIPPVFGRFEIGYTNNTFDVIAYWKFNARKKIENTNLIEGIDNIEQTPLNQYGNTYYGTPAWNTFNMRTKYNIHEDITLFLNFENIFDVHYKEFASAISSGGFNTSFSVLVDI